MSAHDTALLVIDVQEKLLPAIRDHARVVWNVRRLIDGATILGLPVAATEQYPQGLGPTVAELAERLPVRAAKLTFSCGGCPADFRATSAAAASTSCWSAASRPTSAWQQTRAGSAGRRLADVCGGGRRRLAVRDRLSHGARADGLGRRHVDHHRGGAVRVVPGGRHGGVQADQPVGAGARAALTPGPSLKGRGQKIVPSPAGRGLG